jgi:hypothetical protein
VDSLLTTTTTTTTFSTASPNGLYNTQTKLCVLSGVANCYATGQCPQVTSLEQPVAQCCNCTCGATPMGLDAFGRAL